MNDWEDALGRPSCHIGEWTFHILVSGGIELQLSGPEIKPASNKSP